MRTPEDVGFFWLSDPAGAILLLKIVFTVSDRKNIANLANPN